MKSILVVCIGNICRSPMAEGLLRKALPTLTIGSAGLGALVGHPADPIAIELMQEMGVDLSAHRARQLTKDLCAHADLILAMDQDQCNAIALTNPLVRGRIYRLGHFVDVSIPDPYKKDKQYFAECLKLIKQSVDSWVPKIEQLA